MADSWPKKFWEELSRRKVIRVAVVYTVVAWAAVEAASVIFPALLLPEWTERLVVALALLGFPVALALAWAFEVRLDSGPAEPQAAALEPVGEERLDGWKRIAAYLNRDVRTVRRWEKDRGLPVRRLMHDKLATVYAYRSELDDWMTQRDTAAPDTAARPAKIPGKPGLRWIWVALPLLVLGVALAWLWPGQGEEPISFGEWDWVLITKFDNRTGESVLDGTVEYALERELSNSSFVKVVSRERINDALALMKRPPDAEIDLDTGREISLRDGGIRVLLGGRIEKLGNSYLISTDLINPDDGVTLASFSADATSQDQILGQIKTLSGEVRTALGESLQMIEASERMLEKVTTPSLRALQLFSEADRIMSTPERSRAMTILQEAIRLDTDFASAHLLLAYLYGDRDDDEMAKFHLERAVALADHASERERYFILATYYNYLQDAPKSTEIYELMVSRYPDHRWANGNLSNIYEMEGRFEEAKELRTRVAESRPNSVSWYPDLDVVHLSVVTGDTDARDKYVQKLEPFADQPGFDWLWPQLAVLPAHEAWVNGDYEKALDRVEEALAARDREDLLANGFLYAHIRSVYLALGTLERFREVSSWRPELGWFEALLDYDSGRPETLDRYLSSTETDEWDAVLLALTGQAAQARAYAEDPENYASLQPVFTMKAWQALARAQSALAEGNPAEAIPLLENDVRFLSITYKWAHFFSQHSLAKIYEQQGDMEKAIETLEKIAPQKHMSIFELAGTYMWQRNQFYLQRLYRANGQIAAASRVQQELRETLRLADQDHPFLGFNKEVPDSPPETR